MIEIQGKDTELHTIKNPGQVAFLVIVLLAVFIALSIGVGYAASKI